MNDLLQSVNSPNSFKSYSAWGGKYFDQCSGSLKSGISSSGMPSYFNILYYVTPSYSVVPFSISLFNLFADA